MRPAGWFVAAVLSELRQRTRVGVNLLDLDRVAHEMIRTAGATSCYLDYHPSFGARPFGKVLCTSVNDAVLHGIPFNYVLRNGDVVSLDFAAALDGWVADSALTVIVGKARPGDVRLVETTERALAAGIAAALPGGRLGDISAAIARVARNAGYSINTEFGGHGVGRTMHDEPHVPNDGVAGAATWPGDRDRALVPDLNRPDLPGHRRLDAAQRGWLTRGPRRAYSRDHA